MEKNINLEAACSEPSSLYLKIKRLLDVLISIALLIVLAPLLIIICLLLFMMDGRPVFFRQIRVGKDARPFIIWKFRTMPVQETTKDNSKIAARKGWEKGVPDDFVFKSAAPPNVKKFGRLLRKYSLDELPQLFNVLRGEMSLVGPRPEIPDVTLFYNHKQKTRLTVKPGITGYAQINGRSKMNHGQKITFDLYYVYNCSTRLDITIMLASIIKVIRAKNSF